MEISSVVFDLVVLIILLASAAYYASKGFLAGILNFAGTLISIVVGSIAATRLSPALFDSFFRAGIEEKTAMALAEKSAVNLSELLHGVVGFLPDSVINNLVESFGKSLDFSSAEIARQIVDQVVAPLIIPVISVIVFFVVFALLRVLLGVVSAFLSSINKVPLLGTMNKALGSVSGVLVGVLYVFLLLSAIWAIDAAYGGNGLEATYFSKSIVFRVMSGFNIFV